MAALIELKIYLSHYLSILRAFSLYPICLVIAELLLNSWTYWTQIYYIYYSSTIQWIDLKFDGYVPKDTLLSTIYLVFAKLLLNSCTDWTQMNYSYYSSTLKRITLKFLMYVPYYFCTTYLISADLLLNNLTDWNQNL